MLLELPSRMTHIGELISCLYWPDDMPFKAVEIIATKIKELYNLTKLKVKVFVSFKSKNNFIRITLMGNLHQHGSK